MDQAHSGRFKPGVSGNPKGRPPNRATAGAAVGVVRHDSYANPYTGHGTSRDRRGATVYRGDWVSDEEALDLWETEFLAARIIEALPEEAYRRGSSIKMEDKETAEAISALAEDLGVEEKMVEAAEKERALGGAAIFPVIEGAQGDLSQPLDWESISSVSALHVLEPRELMPIAFYESLTDREFRQPSLYQFTPLSGGYGYGAGIQAIHASRLIVFPGLQVSMQRRRQRLGGVSILARPKRVLADFGLAWGSAATLLHEHGVGVLAMDEYAELMATADGQQIVDNRLAGLMMAKSTLRAFVVDGKDKYERLASSLGGLAEVLNEFKVLMSAASDGMPVSVLMGQSQSGLRSGDDDTRTWYANVEKRRAKRYKPRHEQVLRFLLRSADGPTGGVEPDVWCVEYPSLWSPSDKERAETQKIDMEKAKIAVEAGVASADDVAESFYGGDTYSGEIRINWERRRAQAALAAKPTELDQGDLDAMGRGEDGEPEPSDAELAELESEDAEDEQKQKDARAAAKSERKGTPEARPRLIHADARAALAAAQNGRHDEVMYSADQPRPAAPARADEDGPGQRRSFAGFTVVIESPESSTREWVDEDGTPGRTTMLYDYGYILGAAGSDGDSVDVYLGPDEDAEWAYVVHQQRKPAFDEYDEDKVMLGFGSADEARDAYLAQYDDERFFGGMTVLALDDLRRRVDAGVRGKITHEAG